MRRRRSLPSIRRLLSLCEIITGIAVPLALLLTMAQAAPENSPPVSPTETGDNLIADRARAVGDQLSSANDLLSKLKAKAATLAKSGDADTNPPGVSGGTFTKTIAKNSPSPDAGQALDSSGIQLQAAVSDFAAADKINQEVKTWEKSNPAYAQSLRKQALEKLDAAQGWLEKADGNLVTADRLSGANLIGSRPEQKQAALPPPEVVCGLACRQLKQIAGGGEGGRPQLYLFDGAGTPRPDANLGPAVDRILKATFANLHSSPPAGAPLVPAVKNAPPRAAAPPSPTIQREDGRETLALSDRVHLDLSPLHAAIDAVAPSMTGKALLGACDGGGACPTLEFLRLLASPETRAKLRTIGGVALDATFDVLAVSGIPDFRAGVDIKLVENPVLISLNKLEAAAARYAKDWNTLPEALRYPGGIERVHGYVLDPDRDDIVLIGSPATDPMRRLDIDMVVLAVRQVWREGKTMAVSLDPLPNDLGGPQYPRVIDTPADSIVARTMLDADYAMKRMMNLAPGSGPVDMAAVFHAARIEASTSRFWLNPRYLGRNAVYRSQSGRTMLVETGVEVLTEEMFLSNGQFRGSGGSATTPDREAAVFNAAYGRIEDSLDINPRGIFNRLHGLIDVVTLAKIWRNSGLRNDLLARIAQLPYRHLAGPEATPSAYRGVMSEVASADGALFQIVGGVQLELRQTADSERTYADRASAQLESLVDAGGASANVAQRVSLAFGLPSASAQSASEIDKALLAGQRALEGRDFETGERSFHQALQLDPTLPAAYAGLARIFLEEGRFRDAAGEALRAIALAPSNDTYRTLIDDIVWRTDPKSAYPTFDDAARETLSRYYVNLAMLAGRQKNAALVERFAGWAVDVWEENGDAHMLRAFAHPVADIRQSQRDMARAIRGYRRQVEAGRDEARKPLALALTASAMQRIAWATDQIPPATKGAATTARFDATAMLDELERARTEAHEAVGVDAGLPIAPAFEVYAEALATAVTAQSGPTVPASILSAADGVVRRFPDHPEVLVIRAEIRLLARDTAGALSDLDRAVVLAPMRAGGYATRALVNAEARRCPQARADLKKFRDLSPGTAALTSVEAAVAQCRA